MRHFYLLAVAGALTAPLPLLAQDNPAPSRYECSATVGDFPGETVSVSLLFDATGEPIGRTASWSPRQMGDLGRGDLTRPDVTLWIRFDGVSERAIGRAVDAQLSVSVFSPLRERQAPGKLAARLAGFTGQYRFGNAPFVPLASFTSNADTSLPGSAQVSQSIPMPQQTPQWLDVQVLGKGKHVAVSTRFALDSTASRDQLFWLAMDAAQTAALDFKSCPAG